MATVLLALFAVSIISQIDRILPYIMAETIKNDLSLTDTQIVLLTGLAFAVCYTLLSLPLARISDRGSPRLVLVACTLAWSAMTALGSIASSFLFLAFTRFGVAFGEAGAMPAGHAIIARKIPPERRGLAIGLFAMGIPLGTMVGFGLGGSLSDTLGWRVALGAAGAFGGLIAILALVLIAPTPPLRLQQSGTPAQPFFESSARMLSSPAFRWLFIGAVAIGFASAPFYTFAAAFLMRTHELTASQAGLAFGLPQGLMGIIGTLLGGRLFDRSVKAGSRRLLAPPATLFLLGSITTSAGLFAPSAWLTIALFIPTMLSFAFILPFAFGAAHLIAGRGREAQATSLMMVGSGLLGPALGPLIVGLISDTGTASGASNGLALGLLIAPVAAVLTGISMLIADRRIASAPPMTGMKPEG